MKYCILGYQAQLSLGACPPRTYQFAGVKGKDGFLTGWVNAEFSVKKHFGFLLFSK